MEDNNAAKPVAGPQVERPYPFELKSEPNMIKPEVLDKPGLSNLHQGEISSPIKALGAQSLKETHAMGSSMKASTPSIKKGGMSSGMNMSKGAGRSVGKAMMSAMKEKLKEKV